jgi:hypothetical protein
MSDTEIRRFEALAIPNEALEQGGVEILRAAVIEGDLHVTLRRTFDDPKHWGGLLAEVVRRVARAYVAADGKLNENDVAGRIHAAFAKEGGTPKAEPRAKRKSPAKPAKKAARRRKKR